MILSGLLLTYAAILATTAGRFLPRAQWLYRSPRLGIALWLGTSAAVLVAVILAGLQLGLPFGSEQRLGGWLSACLSALATDQGALLTASLAVLGLAAVGVVSGRLVGCVGLGLLRARRARLTHADSISLLAPRPIGEDAVVVHCSTPAAYCLPGARRRIVLTSRAMELLDADEVQAVLAHERAHLHGRHHLLRTLTASVYRAFPWVPLFRHADEQVSRMLEMLADDRAASALNREDLASAMALLAAGVTPAAALGAGGATALNRARRLVAPARPLPTRAAAALCALTVALVLLPLAAAMSSSTAALRMAPCLAHQVSASPSS